MSWDKIFPSSLQPCIEEIECYVNDRNWDELNTHIRTAYKVEPKIEYSSCSGAPGWNVKYKKSGRAICALYPDKGKFICFVCIGQREKQAAEALLDGFSVYMRELYASAPVLNGARWVMAQVTSEEIAADVKKLISTRMK